MPVESEGTFSDFSEDEDGGRKGGKYTGEFRPVPCGTGTCKSVVLTPCKGEIHCGYASVFGMMQNFVGKIIRRQDNIRAEARSGRGQKTWKIAGQTVGNVHEPDAVLKIVLQSKASYGHAFSGQWFGTQMRCAGVWPRHSDASAVLIGG